jgi:hypothetical protein
MGEIDGGEGVGQDRGWRQLRLTGGIERQVGDVTASGFLIAYDARNNVPIAAREDDLQSGRVWYLGGDDQWSGRHVSRRFLLGGRVSRPWKWGGVQVTGWLGSTGFRLRDNQSGYLDSTALGDGYELRQSTFEIGLRGRVSRSFDWLEDQTLLDAGLDLQAQFHRQRTEDVDAEGDFLATDSERRVENNVVAAWARARVGLFRIAQITAAARVEQTELGVRDLEPGQSPRAVEQVGGSALSVAPKLTMSAEPAGGLRLHASFSRGVRPPDARTVTRNAPLFGTRFDTVEGGVRMRPGRALALGVEGFGTWSPSERIRDQLDARLLAVGATTRAGVVGSATVWPIRRVRVETEFSWTDARLREDRSPLPYVARWSAGVGVHADELPIGPVRLSGGVRTWWVGRRLLPGGFAARAAAGVDLNARIYFRRVYFDVAVDNLVPFQWRYAEYIYPSRWDRTTRASPLPVRHVVPFEPSAIRVAFGTRFR